MATALTSNRSERQGRHDKNARRVRPKRFRATEFEFDKFQHPLTFYRNEFKVVSKQYFGGTYQIEVSNNKNILINLMSDETISNDMMIGDSLNLSIESKDIIFLEDK